jgi:hypothetical protein
MMEKRFSIHEGDGERIYIDDDDFHWDALLRVSGDFESCEEKKRYAQAICDVLNAAEDSIPYRPAAETSPAQCDHSWVTSNFEAPRCLWCHVEKSAAETKESLEDEQRRNAEWDRQREQIAPKPAKNR